MKPPAYILFTLLLLGGLALSGCFPASQGQSDEEKEPHFLAGNAKAASREYKAAVESYERALEVNPKSAAAHFELAWIFDTQLSDPVSAIYHYERYIRLRPNAKNMEVVKPRVVACKQEIAKTVSWGVMGEKQQRDLQAAGEEIKRLTEENKRLNEELAKWRAAASAQAAAGTGSPQAPVSGTLVNSNGIAKAPSTVGRTNLAAQGSAPATSRRTYTVKAGDTPTSIARQFGMKASTLMAANPKLDERRMKAGQVINIP